MSDPKDPEKGTEWHKYLLSADAKNCHYQLDNPSNDNSGAYYSTAKELFGADAKVGQCGFHLSCTL